MKLFALFVLVLVLDKSFANTICPGAPKTAYGKGKLGCDAPVCLVAGGGLRPSPDPTRYFMCAGPNRQFEMWCPSGTCFSFEYQTCVHTRDWVDICLRPGETTEAPVTTKAPETEATTIIDSTTLVPTTDPSTTPVAVTDAPTDLPTPEHSTTEEPSTTTELVTDPSTTEEPSTTVELVTDPPTTQEPSTTTELVTDPPTTQEPSTTQGENTGDELLPIPGGVSDGRYVQVCPGFERQNVTYGEESCSLLQCGVQTPSEKKYPYTEPQIYLRCTASHVLRRDRCDPGTCFHFGRQACVPPAEWQNFCSGLGV